MNFQQSQWGMVKLLYEFGIFVLAFIFVNNNITISVKGEWIICLYLSTWSCNNWFDDIEGYKMLYNKRKFYKSSLMVFHDKTWKDDSEVCINGCLYFKDVVVLYHFVI